MGALTIQHKYIMTDVFSYMRIYLFVVSLFFLDKMYNQRLI